MPCVAPAHGRLWLPITALVLSVLFLGPIALLFAYVGWRRIVKVALGPIGGDQGAVRCQDIENGAQV